MRVRVLGLGLAAAGIAVGARDGARAGEAGLVPFVLPWDGGSPYLPEPAADAIPDAGAGGRVQLGADGHLYAGGERVRFLGVNLVFGACFPEADVAAGVARRLASFGVNCVRFHHMDMNAYPGGIRDASAAGTGALDPRALERLDGLIHALRRHGIYTNLNLLVSRPFAAADGLPVEIESIEWKERHVVGFFNRHMIELQKAYARALLEHVNPFSGLAYAADPAVAFVEINNENGLIHSWLGGVLDALPEVFRDELRLAWNKWLRARHASSEALGALWNAEAEPLGAELLRDGEFDQGLAGWVVEQHGTARATAQVMKPGAGESDYLSVHTEQASDAGWHVQVNQAGLAVEGEHSYTLRFRARGEPGFGLDVSLMQAHAPWSGLGFSARVGLDADWQSYEFVLQPDRADTNARVNFGGLGAQLVRLDLDDVSLRAGGRLGLLPGESLEAGNIGLLERGRQGERTAAMQRDFFSFLYETEQAYWREIYRFLKQTIGVEAVVIGTIIGCGPATLMSELDAVDAHAYWQHPRFPGAPWDPVNWYVDNVSMVNEPGGVLNGLARRRVYGKPHLCTEYNHPAPNTYSSEAPLLLALMAGLQDWDGIFLYSYNHNGGRWDKRRIDGFFDIDQHPTKMANLPIAAALFRRGDLSPATARVGAALDPAAERELLRTRGAAWTLVDAGTLGIPEGLGLLHQIGLLVEGIVPAAPVIEWAGPPPASSRWVSDNGQVVWDLSRAGRGVVTIDTPGTKVIAGYPDGRSFRLMPVTFRPGASRQGWCTFAVTLVEGESWHGPARALVVATGYAQNTGMTWTSPEMNSVGAGWGSAPSLVEAVPFRMSVAVAPERVRAWALDAAGGRAAELAVAPAPDGAEIAGGGGAAPTLWYELELAGPQTAAWAVR